MGETKEKSSNTTVVNQTTTPTPTAEETALNQRNLRMAQATEGPQTQAQLSGLNLVNQLLTGNVPQGMYQQLAGGIDANAVGTQATQMMRSGRAGFQGQGLADSGVADRSIAMDIGQNLLYPTQQFNLGALQNLMNLALSGQAQVQQPVQANVNNLSNSLAGLRSMNTQGTTTQSGYTSSNPFLNSFYKSAGNTLGSAGSNMFKNLWA